MSFLASQKYHTHMYRPQEETVSKLSKMWPTEIRQLPESRWSLVDFTTISIQSPRSDTSSIEFTAINFGTTSLHIAFYTWRAGVRAGLCVSFFIVLLLASRSDISSSHRWLRQPPSIILVSAIVHALEGGPSPATVGVRCFSDNVASVAETATLHSSRFCYRPCPGEWPVPGHRWCSL